MSKQKSINIICPRCNKTTETTLSRNFFIFTPKIHCTECGYKGAIPLSLHTLIWYWVVVIIDIALVYDAFHGYQIRLGYLGLIIPISLFLDWKIRKGINQYKTEHQIPFHSSQPLLNEIVKGTIVAVLLLAFTFFLIPIANGTSQIKTYTPDWKPYHSVAGKFSLDFPTIPVTTNTPLTIAGYSGTPINETDYESDISKTENYLASYVMYPDSLKITDAHASLESVVNGSLTNTEGSQLVSSNFITYKNFPGVDYLISVPSKHIFIKTRAIENGQSLYLLAVVSDIQAPAQYERFINSFTLEY